jgi:hypothetical protein
MFFIPPGGTQHDPVCPAGNKSNLQRVIPSPSGPTTEYFSAELQMIVYDDHRTGLKCPFPLPVWLALPEGPALDPAGYSLDELTFEKAVGRTRIQHKLFLVASNGAINIKNPSRTITNHHEPSRMITFR